MARIARVVVEHYPHHITQRGNRRQDTFFCDWDYIQLMAEWFGKYSVEIWAYCLMPNHVHLIVVSDYAEGLCRAIGEAHRRYTRQINFRENWKGHLWQGRFSSLLNGRKVSACCMPATRYVDGLNPVKAGLVSTPEEYHWSSAKAHIRGKDNALVTVKTLLELVSNGQQFLCGDASNDEYELMQQHERTGRRTTFRQQTIYGTVGKPVGQNSDSSKRWSAKENTLN